MRAALLVLIGESLTEGKEAGMTLVVEAKVDFYSSSSSI